MPGADQGITAAAIVQDVHPITGRRCRHGGHCQTARQSTASGASAVADAFHQRAGNADAGKTARPHANGPAANVRQAQASALQMLQKLSKQPGRIPTGTARLHGDTHGSSRIGHNEAGNDGGCIDCGGE